MTFSPAAGPALPIIIGAFLSGAIVALLVTPWIRRLMTNRSMIDHPDERRAHGRPVPRGGGVAVMLAFVIVGGALVVLGPSLPGMPGQRNVTTGHLVGLFGGGILAAVLGVIDDRFDLRARWQLLGQLVLAATAVIAGVSVAAIGDPLGSGRITLDGLAGVGFTIVWIVGMINSLNFIDGLDGLSTGIALIAAVVLGLVGLTTQVIQPFVSVLCFALAGALLGFLRWNFHPASIFPGTAGVMFFGYVLGVLSILGFAKVIVALLVLSVPIIDTFWVIVRRLSTRRSPFSADRGHIHHRLLDLGLSHRATVVLIYGVCATLGLVSLFGSTMISIVTFVATLLAFGVMAFVLRRPPPGTTEAAS